MNATHDAPTTWRDLADQLTPDQIAYLENWEAHPGVPMMSIEHENPQEWHRGSLIFTAQEFADTNKCAETCRDLPMPPDVTVIDGWSNWGDGELYRFFDGTTRSDGGVKVFITGRQYNDGRVEREITVNGSAHTDDRLSAGEARSAARMLVDAADELDQLG
jgi:hypothetical protein